MPFTEIQTKALASKLNAKHVKTRTHDEQTLSYVEGWHLISEANRIFGFDAWDRETVFSQCVWEGQCQGQHACSYIARVKIRVRAEDTVVSREGSGSGDGNSAHPGEAHESALKEAETDAMKRALSTFGNPFGLALYDKEQKGVHHPRSSSSKRPVQWPILSQEGKTLSKHEDPVGFCTAFREALEGIGDSEALLAFWNRNQEAVSQLRIRLPDLKTEKGQHYEEILVALYAAHLKKFEVSGKKDKGNTCSPRNSNSPKSASRLSPRKRKPSVKGPRRVRDSDHLRFVASRNCVICGRNPSQAHHLLFIQPRAMSRKPSDEWTVPLCAIHHRALHDHGNELDWWQQHKLDAKKEALRLWQKSNQLPKAG